MRFAEHGLLPTFLAVFAHKAGASPQFATVSRMIATSDPHYAEAPAAIADGRHVLAKVHDFRARTRWSSRKPGNKKRNRDIQAQINRIDAAMKPLRSYIGKLCWHPAPAELDATLREVSAALQHERKQLKKMLR
jgi:hypothetical protein